MQLRVHRVQYYLNMHIFLFEQKPVLPIENLKGALSEAERAEADRGIQLPAAAMSFPTSKRSGLAFGIGGGLGSRPPSRGLVLSIRLSLVRKSTLFPSIITNARTLQARKTRRVWQFENTRISRFSNVQSNLFFFLAFQTTAEMRRVNWLLSGGCDSVAQW